VRAASGQAAARTKDQLLGAKLFDPALQVTLCLLEHGATPVVKAEVKFSNNVLERESQTLLLAQPGRLFRRQTRLSRRISGRGIFLLRLDRFAFPTPGHKTIVAFRKCFSKSSDAKFRTQCQPR
jgi:hypothetical protein